MFRHFFGAQRRTSFYTASLLARSYQASSRYMGATSRPGCFRSGEERALVAGDAGRRGRERRWSDHPCDAQKFREGLHRAMALLIRMRPAYPSGHRWNRMPARRYALFPRGRTPSEWGGTESRFECCGGSDTQARGTAWVSHLRPFISSRCPSSGGRRALFVRGFLYAGPLCVRHSGTLVRPSREPRTYASVARVVSSRTGPSADEGDPTDGGSI